MLGKSLKTKSILLPNGGLFSGDFSHEYNPYKTNPQKKQMITNPRCLYLSVLSESYKRIKITHAIYARKATNCLSRTAHSPRKDWQWHPRFWPRHSASPGPQKNCPSPVEVGSCSQYLQGFSCMKTVVGTLFGNSEPEFQYDMGIKPAKERTLIPNEWRSQETIWNKYTNWKRCMLNMLTSWSLSPVRSQSPWK